MAALDIMLPLENPTPIILHDNQQVVSTTRKLLTEPTCKANNPFWVYHASQRSEPGRKAVYQGLKTVSRLAGWQGTPDLFPWHKLRYAQVQALRSKIAEHFPSHNSANQAISFIRRVAEEAFKLRYLSGDEYMLIKTIKSIKGYRLPAGRMLSTDEIRQILTYLRNSNQQTDIRNLSMIACLFGSGMRRAELVSLDLKDYNRALSTLTVTGKNNKQRTVYLQPDTVKLLNDWLIQRGYETGPLYIQQRQDVQPLTRLTTTGLSALLVTLAKRSGVARFTAHDTRRTVASNLIDITGDLSAVQKLLGHSDVSTTVRYDRRGERAVQSAAAHLTLPI